MNGRYCHSVRIMFWNVENLYDIYDDTTRLDDAFTPSGAMHWNYSRFQRKINHVAKTILASGDWEPPALVGLCEVENRYVLNKLIHESPLKPFAYRMIHHESPDLRGIDVALIYRPAVFRVISSKPFRIVFPFDTMARTREILLVEGLLSEQDTLTLLINHWPSRRGGYAESQPRRDYTAGVLRKIVDSLLHFNPEKAILIMGDFNDEPGSASIRNVLHALPEDSVRSNSEFANLMLRMTRHEGSYRYKGIWNLLDQFMVSGSLIRNPDFRASGTKLQVIPGSVRIFRDQFLLRDDPNFFGKKPARTFNGYRYEGGFSDHLPIYLDLRL